ncbi:MAG: hypothetical protein AAF518_08965 [Spirochaetota bacterium]
METGKYQEINIEAKKLEIINRIIQLYDYSLLLKLEGILDDSDLEYDEWNGLSKEEITGIKAGLEDIKSGRETPHEVVEKRIDDFI